MQDLKGLAHQGSDVNRSLFPKLGQEPLPEGDGQSCRELRKDKHSQSLVGISRLAAR